MKISTRWLGEFFAADGDTVAGDADALARLLTGRGLEVEAIARGDGGGDGIVAGLIAEIHPHPDAARLRVCRVEVGAAAALQIVCGAANARVGQTVAVALPGARVGGAAVGRVEIRGVASAGMICSASELGMAEGKSAGILVLDETAPGAPLAARLELDDAVLDIAVTPNRGDCLSHLGVAREAAAARGADEGAAPTVRPPAAEFTPVLDERYPLRIEPAAAGGCPRFCAMILRGVGGGASPPWLAARLTRCGLRPVGAAVDITNYVMLELGQPLHAFDLAKLRGGVTVRHARDGEIVRLLGGREAAAHADTLVVADEDGAQALGGIMGGAESGVSETTADILLEAAFWDPAAIRGRARRYRLPSEAAFRFERGVDFTLPPAALRRAGGLFADICGAKAGAVFEARAAADPKRAKIFLPAGKIKSVLGVAVAEDEAAGLLGRLGFAAQTDGGGGIIARAPSWRFDISLSEDLIEEIARLRGYDKLPATLPRAVCDFPPPGPRAAAAALLAARGYAEMIGYAFVPARWESDFYANHDPILLENPIADQMAAMRSGLLGGLADRALFNFHHRQTRVKFFETGRCFVREDGEIAQPSKIAGFAVGERIPHWGEPARALDFYDVKGDVEALLAGRALRFAPPQSPHPALHPGKAAAVFADGEWCGIVGELHPRLAAPFRARPAVFELDLARVDGAAAPPQAKSFSKFPEVRRDLAIVVAADLPAGDALAVAQEFAAQDARVGGVALFDCYAGDNIAAGKKSLGLRVRMQGIDANITDGEITALTDGLLRALTARCAAAPRE